MTSTFRITDHLESVDVSETLRRDARDGLTPTQKTLPAKWLYDSRGSDLFDEITTLDEYYPTEAERDALASHADKIVELSGADVVMELGSGSSDKTITLLDAFQRNDQLTKYVPFDVSESALKSASARLLDRYQGVDIHAVIGDFDQHLDELPRGGKRMLAFLGSTIGNYAPDDRSRLLKSISNTLDSGETLLLGTDLVKPIDRLIAAYDDARGVTAAFNQNVLTVMNRELDANFDVGAFEHAATWDAANEWIEMRLVALRDQHVRIESLDLEISFEKDEWVRTEISSKFRKQHIVDELAAADFSLLGWFTDSAGDFALSLSRRN